MNIINPATEEIIVALAEDNQQTLKDKYHLLESGQKKWRRTSLEERIKLITNYHQLLQEEIEVLAKTLTDEVGKPLQQSRNEINGSRVRIDWMLKHAEEYLMDEIMSESQGLTEMIRYEPLGVIGNISAWNYPYLVGTNVFIPALLAGNAVLYKPSEYATLTGMHIERLLKMAGIPDDVFQIAIGAAAVGEEMLKLPLDGYYFTGSYQTGKYIYERVASKMVPCQCELGGKDPLYVCEDVVDIASVAAATADGAFYNNGQSCCAVERIYVHKNIYEEYLREFVKEVKSWKLGNPNEDGVYIGPLSRKSQIEFLRMQVQDAVQKGAKLECGGKPIEGKGFYFEPTVLTSVHHTMDIMKTESFGPVIGIMKVDNDDEAISLMNDTEYGLTAAVYSSNKERAEQILSLMDSGTGYWNCCDRVSAALPWSGRKHSGFGTTLSHAGLRAFVQPKAYHLKS